MAWHGMACHAMPCHAMPSRPMPSHAIPCPPMPSLALGVVAPRQVVDLGPRPRGGGCGGPVPARPEEHHAHHAIAWQPQEAADKHRHVAAAHQEPVRH
eukprot:1645362-Lingulodinium_polyedra.AAC.1